MNTKVHKIVMYVIDVHEEMGDAQIKELLEINKYITPVIQSVESVDVGQWSDDHPLNQKDRDFKEYFK